MITATPEAAEKILESAKLGNTEGMPLRIAVTRLEDGSFHYAMGFDDVNHEGDKTFQSEGIDIVVGTPSAELLSGLSLSIQTTLPNRHRDRALAALIQMLIGAILSACKPLRDAHESGLSR